MRGDRGRGDLTPETSRGEALRDLASAFAAAGIADARLDARLLAAEALGATAADLLAHPERPVGDASARLAALAARRLAGEPVARILGTWEFWGLTFALSPDTLIPRPDTETVVEAALAAFPGREAPRRLLDLGTGSGCLLVALLSEWPGTWGLGLDRAPGALATARRNALANGVGARAHFVAGDWGAALRSESFDLVVSNPPYVRRAEIASLRPEVSRHEPHAALDGGIDGLDAYRRVLGESVTLLAAGGRLVVEVGFDQADAVGTLGRGCGLAVDRVVRDLAGRDRVVLLRHAGCGEVAGQGREALQNGPRTTF